MKELKTQGEYDLAIEGLKNAVDIYNKSISKDNQYTLFLANGKKIIYTINKNNISHLLGVKL